MDGDLNETTRYTFRAPVSNWRSFTEEPTYVYEAMADTATFDMDRTMNTTYSPSSLGQMDSREEHTTPHSPEMYPWNIVTQQKQQHEFETSAAMTTQQNQDQQNNTHACLGTQHVRTYDVQRRTRKRENRRLARSQTSPDSSQNFIALSSEADVWSTEIPTESTSHVPHMQWRQSLEETSLLYNPPIIQEDTIPLDSCQSPSISALKSQYLHVIVYTEPAGDLTRGRSDRLLSKLGDLAEAYASQCLANIAVAFNGNPTYCKGVGLHLYCENGKTLTWLESTIASLEPLWEGCKLYIKKWENHAKFVKSRLHIPVCSKDITVVTQALRGFNPLYKVQNWEICSYERKQTNPEEAGCLLVLNIPEDIVIRDILPNQRKVQYRMGPCYLKFFTPKGKLVNEYPAIDPVDTSLMINEVNTSARHSFQNSSMCMTSRANTVVSDTEVPETYMPTNENIIESTPKDTDNGRKKLLEDLPTERSQTHKYDCPWPPPIASSPNHSGRREKEIDRRDHRRREKDYSTSRSNTRRNEDRRHRQDYSNIIESDPKGTDDEENKLLDELAPEQPKKRKYDWPWPPPIDSSPIHSGLRERDKGDHRRKQEDYSSSRSDTRRKDDQRHRQDSSNIESEPRGTDGEEKKLHEELAPEQPKKRKYDWPWPPPKDSSPNNSDRREKDKGDHRRRQEDYTTSRSDTRHKEDRRHRQSSSSPRSDQKESKWKQKVEKPPPSGYEDPAMSFPKPVWWVCELDKQRQWVRHLFNRMRNTRHEVDTANYKNALAEYKKTLKREKAKHKRKGRY